MQARRKLITAVSVAVIALVGITQLGANAQENQPRLAHSNGRGTLKVGEEKFEITSVIVKLMEDRKAEITLVSDITFFISGTWSNNAESRQEIDLEITGGATPGGLSVGGKVFLGADGKSVARLNLKGVSKTTKRPVEVTFEGK